MEFPEWDIKENWNVFRWLAVGGVPPSSPFVQQQTTTTHIVTTVLPIGNHPTHMICPRYVLLCYALLSPDALIRCVSLLLLFIFDVSDLFNFFLLQFIHTKQLSCWNTNANTTWARFNCICKRFYYRFNGVSMTFSI